MNKYKIATLCLIVIVILLVGYFFYLFLSNFSWRKGYEQGRIDERAQIINYQTTTLKFFLRNQTDIFEIPLSELCGGK